MDLTKEQFIALSVDEQEVFFTNGGRIVEPPKAERGEQQTTPTNNIAEQSQGIESKEDVNRCSPPPIVEESPASSTTQSPAYLPDELRGSGKDGILIQDPYELLLMVDDDVRTGRVEIYDWQIQFMEDFARGGTVADNPFQAAVRACNGSGKDKYVIAACAVWVCMRYRQTTCPVTSSSGFQLDNQTCKHMQRMCAKWNKMFGASFPWDCKYRNYKFSFQDNPLIDDSEINCYATDEPGKAEGFHPSEHGARMCIFVSEDKSVPDAINNALNKCTGYTHRVHVSTPGSMRGHFYDYCMMAVKRDSIDDVRSVGPTDWIEYWINSDKCPHLGRNYKAQACKNIPGGESSPAYKSQVEAEFGTDDGEMIVIPFTYLWQLVRKTHKQEWFQEGFNTAGVDLSDGGAECALTVRNGNKHIITIGFKFTDTEDTIDFLDAKFREYGLDNAESRIYGDAVGIGKPILNALKRRGWANIVYFDSRVAAFDLKVYKNRNSESWFKVRELLEKREIILDPNETTEGLLVKQLSGRHYKLVDGKIHQMLSKPEEKSKGFLSPDRADSFIYCFWGYKSQVIVQPKIKELPYEVKAVETKTRGEFTLKGWAGATSNKSWPGHDNIKKENFGYLREEIAELNRQRSLSATTN
jgi:hypothetical protein